VIGNVSALPRVEADRPNPDTALEAASPTFGRMGCPKNELGSANDEYGFLISFHLIFLFRLNLSIQRIK
jgi:hypothetical protein